MLGCLDMVQEGIDHVEGVYSTHNALGNPPSTHTYL
jgi:hypothetical protein